MKKRFTFLIAAMMLLAFLTVPMGTKGQSSTSTLTFTAACGGSGTADDGAEWTVTSDGTESSYDATKGIHYGTGTAQVKHIQLSTSDISGTITKVVVNASVASGVSATVGVTVGGSAFGGDPQSLTTSAANYTFTGSASGEIVVLITKPSKAAKALYCKSIAVTYTPSGSPSYTITAESNDDSYGEVSLSGTTITATPASGYRVSTTTPYTVSPANSATVEQNGNEFTVTPSANTTVTINFEAIPTHTATFSVNGTTTTPESYDEGETIVFPADPDDINGKSFVGWTTSTIDGITQVAPTLVTSATMGTSDITYYAVFANIEGSTGSFTLDYGQESDLSNSTEWGTYGNAFTYEASDGSTWVVKAYKNAGMQINTGKDCSIKVPDCPSDITSIAITCSAAKAVGFSADDYSGSGTITYLADGTDATSQTLDLTGEDVASGYIVPKSGSTSITKIVVNYGSLSLSNYCTTVPSLSTWFVTYDGNGNDGGTVPTDGTEYNSSNNTVTVLGPGTLTKTGYSFFCWSDTQDGSGNLYEADDTFTISANTTLYAQWTINSYSYTLNVTGDDTAATAEIEVDGSTAGATITYGKEVEVVVVTSTGYNYSISVMDADNNDVTVANNKFTMPASPVTVTVTTEIIPTYTLVTSTDQLVPGKHYIIASSKTAGEADAMGAQSGNYRGVVAVTITNTGGVTSIEAVDGIRELVLSGNTGKWTLYDNENPGFLYASSKDSNNIGTRDGNGDEDSQWAISFNSNQEAVIIAQGENTRNVIRYNADNTRFSCYRESGSSIENYVYLYVKANDKNYEFYSNTTLGTATVASNETYTIKNSADYSPVLTVTGTLTVNGTLTNNGTAANLVIANGAQLVTNNAVQATIQKSIAKWDDGSVNGWYFIASPVAGSLAPTAVATGASSNMVTDAAGDGNTFDLFKLDMNQSDKQWRNYRQATFNLANGSGYLYANKSDVTLNFTGAVVPSNEDKEVKDLIADEFNLVGNPFTCNAYLNQAYYTLSQANDGIESTTTATVSSVAIAPCTGVIVQTPENTTTVTFSKTASAKSGNINVNLVDAQDGNGTVDNAIVTFNENVQLGKFYFGTQNANIYIPQGDKEYAVVSAEPFGTIPVNFRAEKDGQYTLNIGVEEAEMNYLHLIDNMTGADVDLLVNPSYTFNARNNDYESRFKLVFSSSNTDEAEAESDFAFISNGNLIVAGTGTLQIVDMMGRTIGSYSTSDLISTSDLAQGVYVLRLVNGDNVKTQKIVVK